MNELPNNPLDLAILVYKHLQSPEVVSGQLSGELSEAMDFDLFESHLESKELLIASSKAIRRIECHLPHGFFLSLKQVLEAPSRRISPPQKFYLADIDYLHPGTVTEVPVQVRNYLAASKLYALLAKAADHSGGIAEAKTLIFFLREKIEITPTYAMSDLRELKGISDFETEFIDSQTHKEQKETIVKTVLLAMFAGQTKFSFSDLLQQFDSFIEKVRGSYQLYVSEFSFQKVKAEVEKEKLDATVKLNKVFSDIQNQLLAVPAALVLAGGQMENTNAWTTKNLCIWLGILVFAIFMNLLLRNQKHTLHAVKQEIDQQWEQISGKYHSVAERFKDSYLQLNNRYRHQEWLIRIVSLLVALSLAVTTFLYLDFSVSKSLMFNSLLCGIGFSSPLAAWNLIVWLKSKTSTKL